MIARVVTCIAMATMVCVPARARAQEVESVERLLEMQPAPGVEAMLLAHATDARVGRRWIQLLAHQDAAVRLSAARALGVTSVRTSARELLEALARERDVAVVAEIVQALAIVGSDVDVLQVYAHLDRIGSDTAVALLDGLASARPALAAQHLQTAGPLRFVPTSVRAVYARLAIGSPASADLVDAARTTIAEDTVVEGVIGGATDARRRLPKAIVAAGLAAGLGVRHQTLTYLATVIGTPAGVAGDRALAGLAPANPRAGEESPEGQWVRELERRWLGRKGTTTLVATIANLPDVPWVRTTSPSVLAVLSPDEREAFVRRFALADAGARKLLDAAITGPAPAEPLPTMRLLTDLPAPMVQEVLRFTRCEPQAADERMVTIRYRADRRPAAIAGGPDPFSPGCLRAARAVLGMAYGPPPRVPTDSIAFLMRLDPAFVTCLADRQGGTASAVPGSTEWGVVPPRKVHEVRPTYPDAAVRARLQGIVVVDARIERSGCVSDARVTMSVQEMLDLAALQAVTRWRYTPTTLNGVPVPVIMNVDVNFSLR